MRLFCVSLIMFLAFLSIYAANAQETTGKLEGRILDDQGQPVVGAWVLVTGPTLQGERLVATRSDGRFTIPVLPLGSYQVTFTLEGKEPLSLQDVRIRLGQITNLGDIQLTDQVHVLEDLIVTGRAPLLDPASTELGGSLVDDEFIDLPIERDYRSIAVLLPHVNVSYLGDGINFAGGTGRENKYFIDGVENTDPMSGGPGTTLPYNFVKELQVRVGGYQAEYRGALGGTVNAVTRSGSNEFYGQVFGFYLNNSMTADPVLVEGEEPRGDFALYDMGAGFGGALKKDRLWYFVAYNPSVETEDFEVVGVGTMEEKSVAHRFAGKLNWRLDQSNDLVLSFFGDPRTYDGFMLGPGSPTGYESLDPLLFEAEGGGYTVTLDGQHWLGDNWLIESKLSGYWQLYEFGPATAKAREEPYFFDTETGIVSGGGPGSGGERDIFAGTARLAATVLSPNHTFKSGIEYRLKSINDSGVWSNIFRYYDPTDGEIFETSEYGVTGAKNSNRIPSVFVQVSWRISERLRVNLGLRWDAEFFIDSQGNTAQSITDEWQPRLGFTYQPGAPGRHQIVGSVGRYFQELSLQALAFTYNDQNFYRSYGFDTDPRLGAPADTLYGFEDIGQIQPEEEGLKGQFYDEITLGYDRRLGNRSKISLKGVYRTLGNGLEDSYVEELEKYYWGNPGSGTLSDIPEMEREYTALELTYLNSGNQKYHFLASYVWSRSHGNYPGVWPSEYGGGDSNANAQWDAPDQIRHGYPYDAFSTGPLPNDRPHVFKASGAYEVLRGLKFGTSFTWMSGTPLNRFGASQVLGLSYAHVFLTPRGEEGRTPSIWDLGIRLSYSPPPSFIRGVSSRLILDLLHIGSPRTGVNFDQRKFWGVDENGNQSFENLSFGRVSQYQPPMAVRIGLEVDF